MLAILLSRNVIVASILIRKVIKIFVKLSEKTRTVSFFGCKRPMYSYEKYEERLKVTTISFGRRTLGRTFKM